MSDQNDFTRVFYLEHQPNRPSFTTWVRHILLLMVTLATATVAGSLYPFGPIPIFPDADPQTWSELAQFILTLPARYILLISGAVNTLLTDTGVLTHGLSFSLSLLFILLAHEMGHYVTCRIYKVDATLPFFLPTPPMIGPAGTFGAFIKILSPFPSRKAVFDIGVAGPIAGFIALIPIAVIGIATAEPAPPHQIADYQGLIFSHPLLSRLLAAMMGIDIGMMYGNAFYYAAWVGLLVTALNLIPSGQLDGGHAMYAVLGERIHYWTGRIAFVVMAVLSILGLIYFNSPSGFLIAALLGIMMRIGHPQPWDDSPLDPKRKFVAFLTLIIFVLCFLPFPIKVS
jgi:membrane-associated protease RseP (regulator of RpoE activity)